MLLKFIVHPGRTKQAASPSRLTLGWAALLATLLATGGPLHAQTLYVANGNNNTVGAYNASSGAVLNGYASPTGLLAPDGMAVTGNELFVAYNQSATVRAYNASTGVANGFSLSVTAPVGVAVSGNTLYVSYQVTGPVNGRVGIFDATTGALTGSVASNLVNPQGLTLGGSILYYADAGTNKISAYNTATGGALTGFTSPAAAASATTPGIYTPIFLAVSGNDLFVANQGNNTVGEYDATTGAAINTSFITSLSGPRGLAVSGNILYVSSAPAVNGGVVGEYNATTGAPINPNFLTGDGANGLAISPVPEPATWLGGALLGLAALRGAWRVRRVRG